MSDDLISRQAAIDAIDECYCGGKDSCGEPWIYKENAVEAIQMIEPIPSAGSHWIPCSERLPSKEGEYLITNNAGGVKNIEVDTLLHYEDGEPFWFYSQNPIAWRELPVPFGEE